MQNEKTFDTGELTLSYFEGPNAGPTLVGLHGLTSSKLAWYPLLPKLTSQWHAYIPDLRGHGKSGRAPDNHYRNQDYARDVIAFLKFVGEPVVLMGHSLGAMTAIIVAAQYPAGVRALVLLDPPLCTYTDSVQIEPNSAHWFEMTASIMHDNPAYDTVVERLRERMPGAPDEQVKGTANFMAFVAAGTVETALRDEMWQGVDLPRTLQKIQCPTLLIHGDWESGGAMRKQDVALFTANCPTARVVHFPDADHGLKMREDPELVLREVDTLVPSG